MNEEAKEELLELMLKEYHIVKHIKERCSTVTPEQMVHVSALAKAYNTFVGKLMLKASGCQIPHIVSLTGKLLVGNGKSVA